MRAQPHYVAPCPSCGRLARHGEQRVLIAEARFSMLMPTGNISCSNQSCRDYQPPCEVMTHVR